MRAAWPKGQGVVAMSLLLNLIARIREFIERIRPSEVPDGNPEHL